MEDKRLIIYRTYLKEWGITISKALLDRSADLHSGFISTDYLPEGTDLTLVQFMSLGHNQFWRPRTLQGFEDNNGWKTFNEEITEPGYYIFIYTSGVVDSVVIKKEDQRGLDHINTVVRLRVEKWKKVEMPLY